MQLCSKPRGGKWNRTRDPPKKGSAFITSSNHWTICCTGHPELSKYYHKLATSFGTTYGVACASCKGLPLRQVNTDNI